MIGALGLLAALVTVLAVFWRPLTDQQGDR